MPGSVPLNAPRVFSELTNYLADDWKPIIDTDVDGEGFGPGPHRRRTAHLRGAEPDPPDRPHRLRRLRSYPWAPRTRGSRSRDYGWVSRSQATRSATSGPRWSCSANAPHTCTTTRPATGTTPPRRSPAPAADMADRLREEPEQVWAEIIRRLRATAGKQTGAFTGVHIAPETSGDVPDSQDARLIVIHPKFVHARSDPNNSTPAVVVAEKVGGGPRCAGQTGQRCIRRRRSDRLRTRLSIRERNGGGRRGGRRPHHRANSPCRVRSSPAPTRTGKA